MGEPCCTVGLGGPFKIAPSGLEPGEPRPWHIVWLPKGYAPCEGMFTVALVAPPPSEDWSAYGLGQGERPPMVEAICAAIEALMPPQDQTARDPINPDVGELVARLERYAPSAGDSMKLVLAECISALKRYKYEEEQYGEATALIKRSAALIGTDYLETVQNTAKEWKARADSAEAQVAALKAQLEDWFDEGVLQEALDRSFGDAHGLILRPSSAVVNILGRHMVHHIKDVAAEFALSRTTPTEQGRET